MRFLDCTHNITITLDILVRLFLYNLEYLGNVQTKTFTHAIL